MHVTSIMLQRMLAVGLFLFFSLLPVLGLASSYQQDQGADGIVSIEAENYDLNLSQGSHDWVFVTPVGYSGSGAMEATPNTQTNNDSGYEAGSPRLDFEVNFTYAGTHYIWIRGIGVTNKDDSVHVGLDGVGQATADRISGFGPDWTWSSDTMDLVVATITVATPGVHTVNVWMREDGFVIDKLVLTVSPGFIPSGTGPVESPRGSALVFVPDVLSFNVDEGGSAPSRTIDLDTGEGSIVNYVISDDAAWLSVTPASGTTPSTSTVSADATGLTPATYTATITAVADGHLDDVVDVTLTVRGDTSPYQQDQGVDGIVSIEAENYDLNLSQGSHDWVFVIPVGYSGSGAMEATPNTQTNNNSGYEAGSPRLDFEVNFTHTGTHYVWIRGIGATGRDDSVHVGLDGTGQAGADRISEFGTAWTWSSDTMDLVVATITVATTGVHTVNVWMREDGFVIDKLLLTVSQGFIPSELDHIAIEGQAAVNENGTADYNARAYYTNGSSQLVEPVWSITCPLLAKISATGLLTAYEVIQDESCTVEASYEESGLTETAELHLIISDGVPQPDELIIDNGDLGTSFTGDWPASGGADYYGTQSVYSKTPGGTYRYEASLNGEYELSLWWTQWSSRCTDVPVEIYDGSTLIDTLTLNQQANGGQWNLQGNYIFTGAGSVVFVSQESGCSTNADAVRVKWTDTGAPPTDTGAPVWDTDTGIISASVDSTGGSVIVDFGGATDGIDGTNVIYSIYYAPSSYWNADWSLNSVATTSSGPYTIQGLSDEVEFTFGVRVSDQSGNEENNTITLTATPIWDTPIIDDSQIAVGYEDRHSETVTEQKNQSEVNVNEESTISSAISLQCNAVEFGDSLISPSATVMLKDNFYVIRGATTANWLPPDPGAAGKNTIAGIDSDGDCVRDDVERFISQLLPGKIQKSARKYMFEYAKWRGQFLVSGLNGQDAREITRNLYKSGECVRRLLGNKVKSQDILNRVFAKFHNTFPRSYRYIDNNGVLGGWSTREEIAVSCP